MTPLVLTLFVPLRAGLATDLPAETSYATSRVPRLLEPEWHVGSQETRCFPWHMHAPVEPLTRNAYLPTLLEMIIIIMTTDESHQTSAKR